MRNFLLFLGGRRTLFVGNPDGGPVGPKSFFRSTTSSMGLNQSVSRIVQVLANVSTDMLLAAHVVSVSKSLNISVDSAISLIGQATSEGLVHNESVETLVGIVGTAYSSGDIDQSVLSSLSLSDQALVNLITERTVSDTMSVSGSATSTTSVDESVTSSSSMSGIPTAETDFARTIEGSLVLSATISELVTRTFYESITSAAGLTGVTTNIIDVPAAFPFSCVDSDWTNLSSSGRENIMQCADITLDGDTTHTLSQLENYDVTLANAADACSVGNGDIYYTGKYIYDLHKISSETKVDTSIGAVDTPPANVSTFYSACIGMFESPTGDIYAFWSGDSTYVSPETNFVTKIDVSDDTNSYVDIGTITDRMLSAILASDGDTVYLTTFTNALYKFVMSTHTFSSVAIPDVAGVGAAMGDNIYLVPRTTNAIMILDTSDDSVTIGGNVPELGTSGNRYGGAYGNDQGVFVSCKNAAEAFWIKPDGSIHAIKTHNPTGHATDQFARVAELDGIIFFGVRRATQILAFDPVTEKSWLTGTVSQWYTATPVISNGDLVFLPTNTLGRGIISISPKPNHFVRDVILDTHAQDYLNSGVDVADWLIDCQQRIGKSRFSKLDLETDVRTFIDVPTNFGGEVTRYIRPIILPGEKLFQPYRNNSLLGGAKHVVVTLSDMTYSELTASHVVSKRCISGALNETATHCYFGAGDSGGVFKIIKINVTTGSSIAIDRPAAISGTIDFEASIKLGGFIYFLPRFGTNIMKLDLADDSVVTVPGWPGGEGFQYPHEAGDGGWIISSYYDRFGYVRFRPDGTFYKIPTSFSSGSSIASRRKGRYVISGYSDINLDTFVVRERGTTGVLGVSYSDRGLANTGTSTNVVIPEPSYRTPSISTVAEIRKYDGGCATATGAILVAGSNNKLAKISAAYVKTEFDYAWSDLKARETCSVMLANTGKIFIFPKNRPTGGNYRFKIFDPDTNTFTEEGLTIPGTDWAGRDDLFQTCVAADGKFILSGPTLHPGMFAVEQDGSGATAIGDITPKSNVECVNAILTPDGKSFCVNPDNTTTRTIAQDGTASTNVVTKGQGIALAKNGFAYSTYSSTIYKIDVSAFTKTDIAIIGVTGSVKFKYIINGADGRVYFIPNGGTRFLVLDPTDDSLTLFGEVVSAPGLMLPINMPNGDILCCPGTALEPLQIIHTGTTSPWSDNLRLSGLFNIN